ncbi:MAG: extensin-like domain-containing protein [Shimia sp.]
MPENAICGVPDIIGERREPIPGRRAGCGISNPVEVVQVAGVALSQPAIMDCITARTLRAWVEEGVQPAAAPWGGVVRLQVPAHYVCKTRNSQPGARISEHGKGRAIDISQFHMADGSMLSLLRDWGNGERGRALRSMWSAACGPFGTVLGPESNRFHRGHFHLDTARYRSGAYCR